MNNVWDEISNALAQSRAINHAADQNANTMAELLDGRLRHVSGWKLARLKRQLRDFNIQTRTWKP